jgi:hypothetical protein
MPLTIIKTNLPENPPDDVDALQNYYAMQTTPYLLSYIDMIDVTNDKGEVVQQPRFLLLGRFETYEQANNIQQYLNIQEFIEPPRMGVNQEIPTAQQLVMMLNQTKTETETETEKRPLSIHEV